MLGTRLSGRTWCWASPEEVQKQVKKGSQGKSEIFYSTAFLLNLDRDEAKKVREAI